MIQTMLKRFGTISLVLCVGFLLFSMAAVRGQDTNAIPQTDLLQSAWGEFSSNHFAEAEQSFRAVVAVTPTNAEAFAGLGRSLYKLKQYSEAITNLEWALVLQPGHTNWLLFLGECYNSAGNSSKAANLFQRYVSLRTNDAEGYAWLSLALFQEAQYDKAASAAKRAIALNPTNAWCRRQLGLCLEQLNHHEDAINAFQQAIAINPKDGDAYFHCGFNLFALERLDEATTNFEAAYALQKDNQAARSLLFGCYLGTMQPQKAYQLFPSAFAIGGCVAMLVYLVWLASLMLLSFRVGHRAFAGIRFSATAWSWRQSEASPKTFPGIWFSLAWMATYAGGSVVFFFILGLFSQIKPAESLLADVTLPTIPVLIVWMLGFRRQPWGKPFAWPLHLGTKKTIWLGLFGLVLLWLFNWAYLGLVQLVTHHAPVQETMPLFEPALKAHPLVTFAAIAILMPVVEEILFRGLFYGALERRLPTVGIIAVTSLVFALVHAQLVFFIPLLGVGILLGWARSKTGSIGLPILIHVLNNGLSVLMVILGFGT